MFYFQVFWRILDSADLFQLQVQHGDLSPPTQRTAIVCVKCTARIASLLSGLCTIRCLLVVQFAPIFIGPAFVPLLPDCMSRLIGQQQVELSASNDVEGSQKVRCYLNADEVQNG
jgi:hypothetical protein